MEEKSVYINTLVPTQLAKQVEALALELGVNRSVIVRWALKEYLDRRTAVSPIVSNQITN